MKNLVKTLELFLNTDGWKNSKMSFGTIVLDLCQKCNVENIIAIAKHASCPILLSEIIIKFYDKIDSDTLSKLASKLASTSSGYEKIFNRNCGRSDSSFENKISNPILKKILESDYFNEPINIKTALIASRNRDFTSELLCTNRLKKEDFSKFITSYIKFKKSSDRFAHPPSSILYVLGNCVKRKDCYPNKNLSMDYFSLNQLRRIINFPHDVGDYFITESISYILKNEPGYLKSILKDELEVKSPSDVNKDLLWQFIKLDCLDAKQILFVAKRYPNDRWLLEDCLKAKAMQIAKKESDYVQSLVNVIIERWSRQSLNYNSGGIH